MDPPRPGMRRITKRTNCPNPLFEQWLDEWRQDAADKGSEMQYCFSKALRSLRKYPLPLKSGKECIVLECFGDRLCKMLDKQLDNYRTTHPEIDIMPDEDIFVEPEVPVNPKKKSPKRKRAASKKNQEQEVESSEPANKAPRRSNTRAYVPAWRSGPYAVLLTLLSQEEKPTYQGFMKKADLQHEAQPLCDKSFTKPDPGSHFTAWSSVGGLIKKGLVHKYSNPAKYTLTDEGRVLAIRLKNSGADVNEDTPVSSGPSTTSASPPEKRFGRVSPPPPACSSKTYSHSSASVRDYQATTSSCIVPPIPIPVRPLDHNAMRDQPLSSNGETAVVLEKGNFDVVLLVDTCETKGASKKNDPTVSELTQMKVPFEIRKLEVGDFLWIARSKFSPDELVLPYVVERKRMDDLGGSIKDNRFKEQKFRLKQSGIPNLIYLVESYGSNQPGGIPLNTLQQAAVNTQVVDGFIVKHTIDHRHSMAYLASLTRILGRTFMDKTLLGCPKKDLSCFTLDDDFITVMNFKELKQSSKKNRNFTVKEMFIRQLVQMKGLSVEKAKAIVGRYPTPQTLIQAYRFGGTEALLADIPCRGASDSRTVGSVTSKAIYQLYNSVKLH